MTPAEASVIDFRIYTSQPGVDVYTFSVVRSCMTHVLTLSQHPVGYKQHTLDPSVDGTQVQVPPIMASDDTAPAGPIVVDGHNECTIMSSGQSLMYRCGVEIDYGQPTSSAVEFDVDELLEYRRGCSSATFEEQEPLTPIQRRCQAQNRAAYVFRRSSLVLSMVGME
ncbi:hypothetical protein E4T50_04112 [Aureobasidium sp. EXF-12298]|nr:hypothetical protein E4T50_04112 [Aureobasidium sp. EXF-12298]